MARYVGGGTSTTAAAGCDYRESGDWWLSLFVRYLVSPKQLKSNNRFRVLRIFSGRNDETV